MQDKGKLLFSFAIIADSHLNPIDAGNTSPWETNHMANPRNEVVVAAINRLAPAFAIHVGDVVHPLPSTAQYDKAADYANALYRRLDMPFYIAPGNHDIGDKCLAGNPAASIAAVTCEKYESRFGKQWQRFTHDDVEFVILNACLLGSGLTQEAEQWAFLERALNPSDARRRFVFSHYPPFITDPEECDHYDNMDTAPRMRLLALLKSAKVEALFAGHVHTFFLNTFHGMLSYALPSSTNFRQDYAELFRIDPAQELGRNDLGKFGFFMVDVYEQGHVARFVRTYGATDTADVEVIVAQATTDVRSSQAETLGVSFCHDWSSATCMPFNAPLDAFVRKEARNDYFVLNLWDCAIRNVRVPARDMLDPMVRARIEMLAALGHRFTVFSLAPLAAELLRIVHSLGTSVRAIECIGTQEDLLALTPSRDLPCPLFHAPLFDPRHSQGDKAFDHVMACGVTPEQIAGVMMSGALRHRLNGETGLVVRLSEDHDVLQHVAQLDALRSEHGFPIAVTVELAPASSYTVNFNEGRQAKRVADAALAAMAYPKVIVNIDTFMDIDRGYFARSGLVDRRHNPRLAGRAAREVYGRLAEAGRICIERGRADQNDDRVILRTDRGALSLSVAPQACGADPLTPAIDWLPV